MSFLQLKSKELRFFVNLSQMSVIIALCKFRFSKEKQSDMDIILGTKLRNSMNLEGNYMWKQKFTARNNLKFLRLWDSNWTEKWKIATLTLKVWKDSWKILISQYWPKWCRWFSGCLKNNKKVLVLWPTVIFLKLSKDWRST